jgi:hypothetical protein
MKLGISSLIHWGVLIGYQFRTFAGSYYYKAGFNEQQSRRKANLKLRTLYQQRVPSADKLLFSLTAQLPDQDVSGCHTLEISVKSPCLWAYFHPLTPLLVISVK